MNDHALTIEGLLRDSPGLATHEIAALKAAAIALRAAHTTDEIQGCAWCSEIARGSAVHNDGALHPSCGQPEHGFPLASVQQEGASDV